MTNPYIAYVPVRPELYQRLTDLVEQNPAYFGAGDETPLELAVMAMEAHIESMAEARPVYTLTEVEDAFNLYLKQVNAWEQIQPRNRVILQIHHWGIFQEWLEAGQETSDTKPDRNWSHAPPDECCPACSTEQTWVRHFGGCPHEEKEVTLEDSMKTKAAELVQLLEEADPADLQSILDAYHKVQAKPDEDDDQQKSRLDGGS